MSVVSAWFYQQALLNKKITYVSCIVCPLSVSVVPWHQLSQSAGQNQGHFYLWVTVSAELMLWRGCPSSVRPSIRCPSITRAFSETVKQINAKFCVVKVGIHHISEPFELCLSMSAELMGTKFGHRPSLCQSSVCVTIISELMHTFLSNFISCFPKTCAQTYFEFSKKMGIVFTNIFRLYISWNLFSQYCRSCTCEKNN